VSFRNNGNNEHINTHAEGTYNQSPSPPNPFDEEEEEEEAGDDLDKAKEATEKVGVGTGSNGVENLGRDYQDLVHGCFVDRIIVLPYSMQEKYFP
jgi:hypothetical protein